ncbi:MAG: sigma-70 family RNA polymerase sigma factor [Bacteroidia bacterium]
MQKLSDKKSTDDLQLIALYINDDDKEALGILFERHSMLAYGVSMKYLKDEDESKDAVMQVFEKLMVDLKKYKVENFRAWLHTVVKNHCLMYLRSHAAKEQRYEEVQNYLSESVETENQLHLAIEKEQKLSSLEVAMTYLNEQQQKCIQLFYLREKSYEEVAVETGYTMNEVKSFIQNGKRNLKIIMEKKLKITVNE